MTSSIDSLEKELEALVQQATEEILRAELPNQIDRIRSKYLGRKGSLAGYFSSLRQTPLSAEEKARLGKKLNAVKAQLEEAFDKRKAEAEPGKAGVVLEDLTLPGFLPCVGRLHPITQTISEILTIFRGLGFSAVEGPEIETEYYNFEALNIPPEHPSRESFDTFYLTMEPSPPTEPIPVGKAGTAPAGPPTTPAGRPITPADLPTVPIAVGKAVAAPAGSLPTGLPAKRVQTGAVLPSRPEVIHKPRYRYLLRSHTSPMQIRFMEQHRPPFQIVVPGRVYRPDSVDASHSFQFHQVEGLAVGPGITFGDLKGVLTAWAQGMFGPQAQLRFRPHYFPFTEPSAEVDLACVFCQGSGCRVCGQKGWLEILGCGMVHPNVFKAVRYLGPVVGFAFGMGVERIAMLKYGIEDIRWFAENNLRFLQQFP